MVKAGLYRNVKPFDGNIPDDSFIEYGEEDLPPLQDGEVLFKAIYLSVDPYQKIFQNQLPLGSVMIGEQVARIVESKNPEYAVGKEYLVSCGWRTYTVFNPDKTSIKFRPLHPGLKGLPSSLGLGTVGMPGATAYTGVIKKLDIQPGKTIFINAASGAVGQVAGQIAKIKGLKVIGTAGSKAKCEQLKEFGFDVVFNYKTEDLDKALGDAAPNGVDYYVDQVGGDFSNTVVGKHMASGGRVVVIGSMSEQGRAPSSNVPWGTYIAKELTVTGMVIYKYPLEIWNEAFDNITKWIKEGKLNYKEDITEGFANTRKAFYGLFTGENNGKAIVKI